MIGKGGSRKGDDVLCVCRCGRCGFARKEKGREIERGCVCVWKESGNGLGNSTSYDEREEAHGKDRETGKQRRGEHR